TGHAGGRQDSVRRDRRVRQWSSPLQHQWACCLEERMNRVCIIGWDGATFDLLSPWVKQGRLPNLARVMASGAHGPLRSTIPPWSFQAWSSFLTGKNLGKHGIYDFFRTPLGTYDLEFVNADHRRG